MSFETGSICLKFFEQYVDCFLKGKNAYLEFGEASKEQKLHWQGKKGMDVKWTSINTTQNGSCAK